MAGPGPLNPDPLDPRARPPGPVGAAQAAQEFAAGAHPVVKELVLRADDGRRVLVLAADPARQRRLGELFAALDRDPSTHAVGEVRWRTLGDRPRDPLALRLDLVVRAPVRCRVHLLLSPRDDLVRRAARTCTHVGLLSEEAFARLEADGRCGSRALVLPTPAAADLPLALRI